MHFFLDHYSRTTASGRRFWEAVEAMICALRLLTEEIMEGIRSSLRRWPNLEPALTRATQLQRQLCNGRGPDPHLPSMDWTPPRLLFLRRVASALLRKLESIYEMPSVSVRALNTAWSPHHDKLRHDVSMISDDLNMFYAVASAVQRSPSDRLVVTIVNCS